MRVAIYARVSTESQEARGTIGSQLDVLRKRVTTEGHQLVAEFCDDGCSGARLDRPGLDALRDAAEAGPLSGVCRPIGWPGYMRIRSLCWMNWHVTTSGCCSMTRQHLR